MSDAEYRDVRDVVDWRFSGGMATAPLAGKRLAAVTVAADRQRLIFHLEDGRTVTYTAEGDCCSESWIEHLTVPPDIAGAEVTHWADLDTNGHPENESWRGDNEFIRVYQTSFRTAKGEIIVEYRNSSNGYYGGWLEGPLEAWALDEIAARRRSKEGS